MDYRLGTKMAGVAHLLFRPPPDASAKEVRLAGVKGVGAGIALAAVASFAIALVPLGPRTIVARAVVPFLLLALMLIIIGGYRALFGVETQSGRTRWSRLALLVCFSLVVVALMAVASVVVGTWLGL
jgi:hypothetical protein